MLRLRPWWLFVALVLAASPVSASFPPYVQFDSGSARLTAQAEARLDDAVTWLRSNNAETIWIQAQADRVGPASANLRLSRQRGEAVKAALVRRGFRPDQITIRAYGESRPLVSTPDGVAEPDNRLAIIFIDSMARQPQ